jgi:predicted dehydrogenase
VVRIIVGSRLRITGADAAWYRACATAHVVATVRGLLDVNPTQGQTVAEARAVARYYSDHAEALERFVREKQGQSDD